MKGFKLKYWVVPVIIFLGATILFRSGAFSNEKTKTPAEINALSVRAVAAGFSDVVPTLTLNGSLEGKTSATISAKLAGRIEEVLVQEGQPVKAGDALVKLESVELANSVRSAEDAVTKAKINLDLATADYNRYNKLYEIGAVSEQQFQAAEAKLKSAQADLSSANANRDNARQQYGYGVIVAPVDGVVANKTATIGQVVSPGAALMTVEDIDQVYAVVNIEQKDLGRVKIGQKAEVAVDAYQDKAFEGSVEVINPEAGASNRMFRTKVKIDNSDGALRPGMFAKVRLAVGEASQVLTVPQAAVIQKQGLYFVFTLENNKAVRHQVEIGDVAGDTIQIKSGLQAGEMVIITSASQLKDGQAVKLTD
ncbi:MAG TPA: efflux RND transporter periplasmic adaptor subunit [Selenomonadales bacterium]|nr:efflux RND transporter periplasmic adaptor subunit [Selenomonadales bacterium]